MVDPAGASADCQGRPAHGCRGSLLPPRRLAPVYIATPGGASGSIMVLAPVAAVPGPVPAQGGAADMPIEIDDDPRRARDELAERFGYAPFFNNLRFQGAPWHINIMAPEITAPLSRAAAADAFLVTLAFPARFEAGLSVPAADVGAFCAKQFADPAIGASPKRRLLTLCAAYDCTLVDDGGWARAIMPGDGATFEGDMFVDAGLLLRAAEHCSRAAEAARLKQRLARDLEAYSRLRAACADADCTPQQTAGLARGRIGLSNLLYWALERGAFDDPLARRAAALSDWSSQATAAALTASDEQADRLCREARLDPAACKVAFPHRTGVRVALLRLAQALIETPDAAARRAHVEEFLASRAHEIAGQQTYLGQIVAGLNG